MNGLWHIKGKIHWGLENDHSNLEPLQIPDVFESPILNGKKQNGHHFGSIFEWFDRAYQILCQRAGHVRLSRINPGHADRGFGLNAFVSPEEEVRQDSRDFPTLTHELHQWRVFIPVSGKTNILSYLILDMYAPTCRIVIQPILLRTYYNPKKCCLSLA